jgi:hemerythrin superfamily protein
MIVEHEKTELIQRIRYAKKEIEQLKKEMIKDKYPDG